MMRGNSSPKVTSGSGKKKTKKLILSELDSVRSPDSRQVLKAKTPDSKSLTKESSFVASTLKNNMNQIQKDRRDSIDNKLIDSKDQSPVSPLLLAQHIDSIQEVEENDVKLKRLSALNKTLLQKISAINCFSRNSSVSNTREDDNEPTLTDDIEKDEESNKVLSESISNMVIKNDVSKVTTTKLNSDVIISTLDNKFNCEPKYFIFGRDDDFKDGLTKKITSQTRTSSMREECTKNENGKWLAAFNYVVNEVAVEVVETETRIRDKDHNGMTLQDFVKHWKAIEAGLTQAEVVALRLYTGPLFSPWNWALRLYEEDPSKLQSWETCISVLYSAIFKLSFLSPNTTVWRGVNEESFELSNDFIEANSKSFNGGVELAFMSTSMDFKVAAHEYAGRNGTSKKGTILEIHFDAANRGADVEWVSQYPHEKELLYPPCTYLTCTEPWSIIPEGKIGEGLRYLKVRANVSTARPNVENIITVDDPETEYTIREDPSYYKLSKEKHFVFGNFEDYKYGLTKKIKSLERSMKKECTLNDNGKWEKEYNYVVNESAIENVDEWSHRIRDQGHSGMTLQDFVKHPMAIKAELTQAEVVALRLYTGVMFKPWNAALRLYSINPSRLRCWSTCIAVLYNAIYKLSLLSEKNVLYRGVNENDLELPPYFLGGVELAFMTTFVELTVAIEYALKPLEGSSGKGTIFEIHFDAASRGANVHWVSQYPHGTELLYPPCTYLTTESESIRSLGDNLRLVKVRATVSTARPNVDNIQTVDDPEILDYEIQPDPTYYDPSNTKYFVFGSFDDYKYGLTKKITSLERSMREECTKNENGIWLNEFNYVVNEIARELTEKGNHIRDKGHSGCTLKEFENHQKAIQAGLTQAEVAAIRLYTGRLYEPWNAALRLSTINPSRFRCWKTCIAVLNTAIAKLSFLSPPLVVYRGFDEEQRKIPPEFLEPKDHYSFAGGVEIAFMTTTSEIAEAVDYVKKGNSSKGTIFEIHFDAASRGADVEWISQYPENKALIYPPCTYLTCESSSIISDGPGKGMKMVKVRATVSTARPSVDNILTVDDPEIEYKIRENPLYHYYSKSDEKLIFGSAEDFKYGLTKKIKSLKRSIREECTQNDNGKWLSDFNYVVEQCADIKESLKAGMTLQDFINHKTAIKAGLTEAEVVALRLYTGRLYSPWNEALRLYSINPSRLRCWSTCIAVLYNAIFKLSFLSEKTTVYRFISETRQKLPQYFLEPKDSKSFAGGVELAFMTTSLSKEETIKYARKEDPNAIILEINFDAASRGANVEWVSQSDFDAMLIFLPCTYLTCENKGNPIPTDPGMRLVPVRAAVSTARVDVKNILTVDDKDHA